MTLRARNLLPLALAFAGALIASTHGFVGEALAQDDASATSGSTSTPTATPDLDREEKKERRVLRERDVRDLDVSDEYRKLARQKRHESIEFLKQILTQGTAQGEQKAEMMLRLADLYFEEGRDIYLSEMQKFQDEYDRCFNAKGCNPETMKPDNEESRTWQDKSIRLYRQILQHYPQYQRADEATYYLATALLDTEKPDDAVREYTRLVRTYPESKWVPDAYVSIGEYYFDRNNAFKALVAYQKAAAYRDSDKYAFALYKLAWCFYNVGEYGKAIDTMKTVVAQSQPTAEGGRANTKKIQLQEEALKDLVRFFADAGEMDEAYAYFNKLGKKELIRSMLKRLASTYFEQGKFEQCIQTYRRLIAEDPQSKDAPDYQNEIIQAYQKIGKKQETLAEIDRLLKSYGKTSAWARANATNQDSIEHASQFIEKNLRTVASNYHNDAKKLGSTSVAKETYALAYKAYTVYLQEFPESQYAYDVRYAFGELLYKIKRFDEAYDQYMKVVSIDPKGKHTEFCSESAIFAADEMLKKEGGGASSPNPGRSTEAVELSPWEGKLLTALDQYSKLFPTSPKTKNVIYKSAYLLYNKNQFKDASDRFRVVIGMDPSSKEAELAANLILDSFDLSEDWKNLHEVSKAFYDQEGLGSKEFKKDVYNIYERASFKLIEINFGKSQDKKTAADSYMAFFAEFPTSEVADLALNNAAVYYHDTGFFMKAMDSRLTLIDKFPKSKFYKDQVASLGFDYESIADFSNAAFWYEKLFGLDKDHASAPDALYSAALFRRALGEWQTALKNYQQYITAYPSRDNVDKVNLEIGKIYEENEKWAEASKVYNTFYKRKDTSKVDPEQLFYARLRYGVCLKKLGQEQAADKHWAETMEVVKKARASSTDLTTSMEFIAQVMFEQAEDVYVKFEAKLINGPGTQRVGRMQTDRLLKEQLTAKAKALKEMEDIYGNIINTGAGEWGLAALVRLGQAYENMSETLRTSYVPSYLTPEQKEFYEAALMDKMFPQIQKAVEAYTKALEKSFELSLYNENTAFATRRLGDLRPKEFPGLAETVLDPQYQTTRVFSAEFVTD
ncbi:MAG: tetratricopeptide repeat protein [Deltaproteobacteria bacterium]|nr:tetratricopeptide repeat protein [Deltaproteobacteria bacterium]